MEALQTVDYQTHGLDVEVYDQRFEGGDPLLEGDVDFYVDYARKLGKGGRGPILELGSGTGRITWELAKAGMGVVGLDLSETMLHIAEEKRMSMSTDVSRRASFVPGDMTSFDLGTKYPLVIIPARSFQCLETVEQQKLCLWSVKKHMEKGARLIIDLFDPRFDAHTEEDWQEDIESIPVVRHPKTGNIVNIEFLERKSDMFNQTFEEHYLYSEVNFAGRVVRQQKAKLKMRWSSRQEMRHLFEICGFKVENEFSDFKKSPPAYGKEQIWVVKLA